MKPGEMLTAILGIATQRHAGQYDKQGKPYILHCLKVMHYLDSDDEELQCIAVGHDLIEDTKTTFAELKDIGMSDRVIEGIRCMTRMPGETEDDYQNRVKGNRDTIKVKRADIRHNTDIRRLKGISDKDITRIRKYHKLYLELVELDES